MRNGKSYAIAIVLVCMTASYLLFVPGCGQEAEAGFQIDELEIKIKANPEEELLDITTFLHIRRDMSTEKQSFAFLQPTEITRVYDVQSGEDLSYEITPVPQVQDVYDLEIDLGKCSEESVIGLIYQYDDESFFGYGFNPSTKDNLIFGQVTKESIFSSHLYYYPFSLGLARQASVEIVAPRGWVGVSSGNLTTQEDLQGNKTLYKYEIPFASGRLPYPLAIYPYEVTEAVYEDRLPVMIFSAKEDVPYAEEKLELVTDKILPFLEELMGEFPFENLRVVEVFPKEGNTGLAAKSLVMLSQKIWFAAPIEDNYDRAPATVLVDEIAHQWNYYKVMFPNYLAEGISEYTDNLFLERYVDKDILSEKMESYRQGYDRIAKFLNALKPLKDSGATMEEASTQLGVSVADIEPFWPFADYGEVPITDPNVYLPMYFLKGALAIDALRNELGDEVFFKGFKRLFSKRSEEEATLDYFKECFESECDKSLDAFFEKWYFETGLPSE